MNWYLSALKKYFEFNGRSQRAEYWFFFLFNMIFSIVLVVVDGVIGTLDVEAGMGVLSGLYSLAVLIPGIAVTVRRLHDTGRSGWWIVIGLVPLIGVIVLLIFMALDSASGDNRFGPNPKAA